MVGTHRPLGENVIGKEHLPRFLADSAAPFTPSGLLHPGFSIDKLEQDVIQEALARASGNKTEAAKLLGITRRRLYSRLKSQEQSDEGDEPDKEKDITTKGKGVS